MASEEQDPTEAALAPGGRRQRPPSTIDLTATDISEPAEPPSMAAEPALAGESDSSIAPDAAAVPGPPRPDLGGDGTAGNDGSQPRLHQMPRERRRRPVLAFASAGAAVAILATALPWVLGVLAPRDSGSDELAARIAGLELQLRDVASRPPTAPPDRSSGDLGARIEAISRQLARLEATDARPPRQDGAPSAPAAAAPDPALAERLAATETAVRALDGSIADLRGRLDSIAASQPAAADRGALDALTARLAALEAANRTLDTRLTASTTGADAPVRVALVALELRVAVERGVPFATEFAAAKPLIQEKALLAALEPAAATGVPTPQALSRQLANVSPAMLRAAGASAHEGGVLERLQANAGRLVRIRPIEETQGDDPSTVIVRGEIKATRGDIPGALAEISALPADIKAPAAEWIKAAQLRVGAVDAARQFSAGALAALGKPTP